MTDNETISLGNDNEIEILAKKIKLKVCELIDENRSDEAKKVLCQCQFARKFDAELDMLCLSSDIDEIESEHKNRCLWKETYDSRQLISKVNWMVGQIREIDEECTDTTINDLVIFLT